MSQKAIYLIRAENGLVKIGLGESPKKRLSQAQSSSPIRLELIHMASVDNAEEVEKSLHQLYAAKRSHGEWFQLTEDDVSDIKNRFPFTDIAYAAEKTNILLGLTAEEICLVREAAKSQGMPVTQFVMYHTLEAAKKIIENFSTCT